MAKGVIPSSHPLSIGTVGLKAHDLVAFGIDEADLVICIGYDLVGQSAHWNPNHDKRIIHIDGRQRKWTLHRRSRCDRRYQRYYERIGARTERTVEPQ